jgi:hypothetical protein
MRRSRGIAAFVVGAAVVAAWSAGELSGQTSSSSAAKRKFLPGGPNGFCPNRVIREAGAWAPKRRFVVYETSGDARGPHIFTASITSGVYYCADGRTQATYDFHWDMSNISGTTITGQVHVTRADGSSRASRIFNLPPRSAWRCCDGTPEQVIFPKPIRRLTTIDVKPLFNKNPTAYSVVDTKGGLQAAYHLAPLPR